MSQRFRMSRRLVVTPEEAQENRWFVEQRKLADTFPQFRMVRREGRIAGVVGVLTTNLGNDYGIFVEVPEQYPYDCPRVFARGWTIQDGCPHRYSPQQLCIMQSNHWSSQFTLAFVVAKAAFWLNKYDVWRETGTWPGNQHEFRESDLSTFRRFVQELFS